MRFILFIIPILFYFSISAQSLKFDNSWVFGNSAYGGATNNYVYTFYNNKFEFNNNLPAILPMDISNSSISDSLGNLLFYTNGVSIANKNGKYMDGGKYINPIISSTPWFSYGAAIPQQCLIFPCNNNKYMIFHSDEIHTNIDITYRYISPSIYYTLIDMSENNGEGNVKKLNSLIIKDTFNTGQLAACKHANGRDWWVINQKYNTSTFFEYLITDNKVLSVDTQNIGKNIFYPAGQSLFTPNGEKYIRSESFAINEPSYLQIFDFDRCSGKLSNERLIILEDSSSVYVCGGAVSPNSRYVYVTYFKYIIQFDLWADDIAASRDTVAIYDDFKTPLGSWTTFWLAQLGPDGRIYIMTGPNGTDFLHVIDQPDKKGKACNVLQHAIQLPTGSAWTIPNFPNYRLGPLKGSPCDTVSVATKDIKPEDYGIKLFPNPSSTIIKIDITIPQYDPTIKTEVVVVDVSGAIVMRYVMPDFAYLATLDISKLPSGVYGVQLRQPQKSGERVLATEKLVVVE